MGEGGVIRLPEQLQHELKFMSALHIVFDAMLFLHLQATETSPPDTSGGDFNLGRVFAASL